MRISLVIVLAALVACGPMAGHEEVKNPSGEAGSGSTAAAKPGAPGDVAFEVTPPTEIKGLVLEPEALYLPPWQLYEPKRKTTIEKQRDVFAKTKDPVQKEAQAAILATLLYEKAKDEKDDAKKTELQTEARQALRDAATQSGDNVDEVTLGLLGRYELLLNDYAASEKAWATLVTKLPKDKAVQQNRTWWVYTLLKQFKNAEALAAVGSDPPSEKWPELAYVMAWAKFRNNDMAGAWQAIVVAAKGWKDSPNRDQLDNDVYLFAGRTGTPLADILAALTPIYAKGGGEMKVDLLARHLLPSFTFSGRWKDAIDVIEQTLAVPGAKIVAKEQTVLRLAEGEDTERLDDPVTAQKYGQQVLDALAKCDTCTSADSENLVESVYVMGRLFHILYATANDTRYQQPAHDLYMATMGKITDEKTRTEAEKDSGILDGTIKNMKAGTGTHDKQALAPLLSLHNQEVQACYELGLGNNPKLAGNLVLTLEADQTGTIKGASTEPKAGLADMSLVASCVIEHAKQWRLPKVPHPQTTRIKLTYTMHVRERTPAAAGGASGNAAKSGK